MRAPISKTTLTALQKQARELWPAIDSVCYHIVITDKDANVIYANKAAEKHTGFILEEMLGKNPADLWGGLMPKEFYEKMWHTIKFDKVPFRGEVQNKRRDGSLYWQEICICPVLDKKDEVKFFVAIEPEITSQKQKEIFREEFISILAHELQNGLAAGKWHLEFLTEIGPMNQDQRETIQKVYQGNQALLNLVNEISALYRAETIVPSTEQSDLAEEIESITAKTKKDYPHVDLSFRKTNAKFILQSNKLLTRQIFKNLINNAAEYCDPNKPKVEIELKKETNQYIFSAANNGFSIPEKDRPKIFSRFFRASNVPGREGGIGLGLFIVKTICDNFGWEISFKSPWQKNEGAIFFVRIPIS